MVTFARGCPWEVTDQTDTCVALKSRTIGYFSSKIIKQRNYSKTRPDLEGFSSAFDKYVRWKNAKGKKQLGPLKTSSLSVSIGAIF